MGEVVVEAELRGGCLCADWIRIRGAVAWLGGFRTLRVAGLPGHADEVLVTVPTRDTVRWDPLCFPRGGADAPVKLRIRGDEPVRAPRRERRAAAHPHARASGAPARRRDDDACARV